MDTVIKVTIKNNYGSEVIYVADDKAEALRALTGTKTLTRVHVAALKKLGFTFEIVSSEVSL